MWIMGSFRSIISSLRNGIIKTPLVCKLLYAVVLLGFAICSLNKWTLNYLTIVPFNLLKLWIWTLASFWAFEPNVFLLVNHLICLHVAFTVLESMWGMRELVKYFLIVNLTSAMVSLFVFTSIYFLTGVEKFYFFNVDDAFSIRGLAAFDAAILVAVKQTMPDTVIFNSPLGRYKNNLFPMTWIVFVLVLTLFGLLCIVYFCMFIAGFYVSWFYLRFYQTHKNDSQGDMTESFSFASFFPPPLQAPIGVLSGVMYKIVLRLKIVKPSIRRFDVSSQLQNITVTLPGSEMSAEAERRKQKALRDLNERLAKAKEQQLSSWDDDAPGNNETLSQSQPQTHQTSPIPSSPIDVENASDKAEMV